MLIGELFLRLPYSLEALVKPEKYKVIEITAENPKFIVSEDCNLFSICYQSVLNNHIIYLPIVENVSVDTLKVWLTENVEKLQSDNVVHFIKYYKKIE